MFLFIFPGGAKNVSSRGKTNLAFVEDTDEDDGHDGHGGHEDDVQSSVLPWKRNNTDSEMNKPMKQSEFPSWINNKEYTQNYSPYNTVNQGKWLNLDVYFFLILSSFLLYGYPLLSTPWIGVLLWWRLRVGVILTRHDNRRLACLGLLWAEHTPLKKGEKFTHLLFTVSKVRGFWTANERRKHCLTMWVWEKKEQSFLSIRRVKRFSLLLCDYYT